MSDIKEILNVSSEQQPKSIKKSPYASIKANKPTNVSREVFALTKGPGGISEKEAEHLSEKALLEKKQQLSNTVTSTGGIINLPTIAAGRGKFCNGISLMPGNFRKNKLSKVSGWRWLPFTSSARSDGAKFHHWAKVSNKLASPSSNEKEEDYAFARFNKKIKIWDYSNDEYENYFKDDNWTKQETDQLLDLCKRFDLRFIVIYDKFDSDKTIEDLKDRFYSIQSKLTELRDDVDSPHYNYTFDKDRETQRKEQWEKLDKRTKDQIKEEEELQIEMKRIEQQQKKKEKDRKKGS